MLQDNSLIFFEGKTAPNQAKALELDGSSYGRDYIFCTIPAGVTALTLKLSTSKDGETFNEVKTHVATAEDIARGVTGFHTPMNDVKAAKVVPVITGTAGKDLVCGITDALDNTEVFYPAAAE